MIKIFHNEINAMQIHTNVSIPFVWDKVSLHDHVITVQYPEVINGAIAGSAPILSFDGVSKESAKRAGPTSYWKIVSDDATAAFGAAPRCANNIRRSWDIIDSMAAKGSDGLTTLGNLFKMCQAPRNEADVFALKVFIMYGFDMMVSCCR